MAVSAGCWNCISGRVSILRSSLSKWQHTTPSVREAPLLSRAFRRDHSGTIPAPGSFAKFKGSVLAGNPSPSESTSNSQHEKQYACDCIQSLILRDALGSSPAPRLWGGTTAHQPCSVPSTPCRNIPKPWALQTRALHWLPTVMKEQKQVQVTQYSRRSENCFPHYNWITVKYDLTHGSYIRKTWLTSPRQSFQIPPFLEILGVTMCYIQLKSVPLNLWI